MCVDQFGLIDIDSSHTIVFIEVYWCFKVFKISISFLFMESVFRWRTSSPSASGGRFHLCGSNRHCLIELFISNRFDVVHCFAWFVITLYLLYINPHPAIVTNPTNDVICAYHSYWILMKLSRVSPELTHSKVAGKLVDSNHFETRLKNIQKYKYT